MYFVHRIRKTNDVYDKGIEIKEIGKEDEQNAEKN